MPKTESFNREEVMDKAMNLFWRKGYNGTSMQDLVDSTELNRSSIYNTFGDKFSLFVESLKRYQRIERTKLHEFLIKENSPKSALRMFFEGIVDRITKDTDNKGCYLTNCTAELSAVDDDTKKLLLENQNGMLDLLEDLLNSAYERGEIEDKGNIRNLALFLFSSLQGMRITSMLMDDKKALDSLVDNIFKVVK